MILCAIWEATFWTCLKAAARLAVALLDNFPLVPPHFPLLFACTKKQIFIDMSSDDPWDLLSQEANIDNDSLHVCWEAESICILFPPFVFLGDQWKLIWLQALKPAPSPQFREERRPILWPSIDSAKATMLSEFIRRCLLGTAGPIIVISLIILLIQPSLQCKVLP